MPAADDASARHAAPDGDAGAAAWDFAGLLLTYWCSARCAFCYLHCGPDRHDHMGAPFALALWRGLDHHAAAHGKTMRVHLAGGEPFRDWPQLAGLVRAARDAGLTALEKIETNAYWATDDGLTRARLELLAALGLQKLTVSTDVFHQEFVPFERVERCVRFGRAVLGRGRVQVRRWDFFNHPLDVRRMTPTERAAAFRAALQRHSERLNGRAAGPLADLLPLAAADTWAGQDCRAEILHSRHVHIDSSGCIFPGTCTGIILGRAGPAAGSIDAAWHAFAADWPRSPLLAALVRGGSFALLQRVRPLGYEPRPQGYASKCHLCTHIRQFLVERGIWPDAVGPRACYA